MAKTKKNLGKIKKKLEKEKEDLEKELKEHSQAPDFGSEFDPDYETDESAAFSNQLSIYQTFKNKLAGIVSALNKIRRGKYGVCEKCGGEISPEILEIAPESKLCHKCKKLYGNSGASKNF